MPTRTRVRKAPAGLPPALRALADPTRLRILLALEGKPRTVGEIVDAFALAQPTISRHLQTLGAAGLVERRRQGQHVLYQTHGPNLGTVCVTLAGAFPCCDLVVRPRNPARRRQTKTTGRKTATRRARKSGPKAKRS